jgi:hypothetical protein
MKVMPAVQYKSAEMREPVPKIQEVAVGEGNGFTVTNEELFERFMQDIKEEGES